MKDSALLHLQGRHFAVYNARAMSCMTFKFYITHFTFCGFVVSNQIHINRIIPTVPIRVKN